MDMDSPASSKAGSTCLEKDDLLNSETDAFIANKQQEAASHFRAYRLLFLAWILSTFFFASLSMVLLLKIRRLGSYEKGFITDFAPVKTAIGITEYQFTGGLELDKNGKLHRVNTTKPQYVGLPQGGIDEAWDALISGLEIIVSDSEAETVKGTTVKEPKGGYRLSLDMYHSLHCINEVRKALDFHYYYPTGEAPYFHRDHIDHCIDYLRQVVQCQGDLTPLTYYWDSRYKAIFPKFGASHTCRNFAKVHEWALQRRAIPTPQPSVQPSPE